MMTVMKLLALSVDDGRPALQLPTLVSCISIFWRRSKLPPHSRTLEHDPIHYSGYITLILNFMYYQV